MRTSSLILLMTAAITRSVLANPVPLEAGPLEVRMPQETYSTYSKRDAVSTTFAIQARTTGSTEELGRPPQPPSPTGAKERRQEGGSGICTTCAQPDPPRKLKARTTGSGEEPGRPTQPPSPTGKKERRQEGVSGICTTCAQPDPPVMVVGRAPQTSGSGQEPGHPAQPLSPTGA